MNSRTRAALDFAGAQAPTFAVLAVLAALAWWGYAKDWKMPKFASLWGNPAGEKTKDGKEEDDNAADKKEDKDKLSPIRLDSGEAADKAGIEAKPAEEGTVVEEVIAHGEVDYDQNRLAHLSSRAPGTVWSVEKQLGDPVAKGEVLALVSSALVGKAKGEFLNSLVQYHVKAKQLERTQAAADSIPERQLREAEAQMREARVRLFGDQQALLNLGLEARLEDFLPLKDEEAVRRLRVLGLPAAVLRRVDPDTLTSNLLPLTAPFDGTIVRRDIVAGEQVSTSAMHFTVADLRQVWVMLYVRLDDVGRLARDQEVTFLPDGGPEEVPSGRVAWIGAEVDEKTHRVPVRVDVPNSGGLLRPHTFGTGKIRVGQHPGVWVPEEAVQWVQLDPARPLGHVVFVEESPGRVYQPRRVEVGAREKRRDGKRQRVFVEVRGIRADEGVIGGILAGERVVGPGSHVLKSEMMKDLIGEGD
jgi:cobalt-zinc-cadmium efflux system membrane fusion protein